MTVLSEDDVVNGCVLAPHGYVYRPPAPSKQLTIEMQVSVTECRGWREVLQVVDALGDLFDFRNTSTAVHRVAKFSVPRRIKKAPRWGVGLFDPLFLALRRLRRALQRWRRVKRGWRKRTGASRGCCSCCGPSARREERV